MAGSPAWMRDETIAATQRATIINDKGRTARPPRVLTDEHRQPGEHRAFSMLAYLWRGDARPKNRCRTSRPSTTPPSTRYARVQTRTLHDWFLRRVQD